MKTKNALLVLIFAIFIIESYGQECKFEINKKDEFTGELKRKTMDLVFKNSSYREVYFLISRIDTSYTIQILYVNSTLKLANPVQYSCSANDQLMIQLNNNVILKLALYGNAYESRMENADQLTQAMLGTWSNLSKKNKIIFAPIFIATKIDIEQLSNSEILKMRITANGINLVTKVPEENIEFSVSEKCKPLIKTDAYCILH